MTFLKNKKISPKKHVEKHGGFAMLVFVLIIAMALLLMMIEYSQNQRQIADNVREIIKKERSIQSSLICAGYISNILAKHPLLQSDLILNIKNLKMTELEDKNYWVNKTSYSNYNQKGIEDFNCQVIEFDVCAGAGGECNYKAKIEGFNTFNNQDEDNRSTIFIEWKLDEYRFYISKLKLI